MKKLGLFLIVFALAFSLAACNSEKPTTPPPPDTSPQVVQQAPTDAQINDAYILAREAMGWFQMGTLPNNNGKVTHPDFKTVADLKNYLQSIFAADIVERLFNTDNMFNTPELYYDVDNELHVRAGDRGGDLLKGKETYEIIREGDKKIIYRVTVEDIDDPVTENVTGHTVHDMIYEADGDNWVFSFFELVR